MKIILAFVILLIYVFFILLIKNKNIEHITSIYPQNKKQETDLNASIIIITHDPKAGIETKNSLLPLSSKFFIGKNYESFSKLVNHAIVSADNEIVIICSYKVRPTPNDINRMLNYINEGYGFVALFRFAFFGFKKELFRRV